jgi:hypothetical protein
VSLGLLIAVAVSVVSFAVGVYCMIRYGKTRQVGLVYVGLLLMFILPGVLLLGTLNGFRPPAMGCYGPPPPEYYTTTTLR